MVLKLAPTGHKSITLPDNWTPWTFLNKLLSPCFPLPIALISGTPATSVANLNTSGTMNTSGHLSFDQRAHIFFAYISVF